MPETATIPRAGLVSGRHAVPVMGTVVSFDLRDPVPADALRDVIALLHEIDATFSTYRSDSVISQLRRRHRPVTECPADVIEVLGLCETATDMTDGYFTAFPYGELDPTGLVKGWAIQRASDALVDAGSRHHSVNGGGDIQLVGGAAGSAPWRIGVADPRDPASLLAVVAACDLAVATSGTAERGAHIVDPTTYRPADHFASVTITAATLLDADVFATAAFARGADAVGWVEQLDGIEGLFLDNAGNLMATTGFPVAA